MGVVLEDTLILYFFSHFKVFKINKKDCTLLKWIVIWERHVYYIAANFHASNQSQVQPIFTDKTQGGTGGYMYYIVIGRGGGM